MADNAARLPGAGPGAASLIVTAAWTGARWGELVGLQRPNPHLDGAALVVDPDIGAPHESSQGLHLGPPKTVESARSIALPPFLVELLRAHLDTHDHRHVCVTPERQLYRRSNFSRRAMSPSADGNRARPRAEVQVAAVKAGLTFHGLRHSHKTRMIADGVPEIAQAHRFGHILGDKIQQTYSHVAPEVERRLLDGLTDRRAKAVVDTGLDQRWRSVP